MDKFKNKNPDYFKNYYQKNKDIFKQRNNKRPSTRQIFYSIKINDITYCFETKKAMNIQKINKEKINGKNFKLITNTNHTNTDTDTNTTNTDTDTDTNNGKQTENKKKQTKTHQKITKKRTKNAKIMQKRTKKCKNEQ